MKGRDQVESFSLPDEGLAKPVNTRKESLESTELEHIDAYWWAANYLGVGQIYLRDNPLLEEPLKIEYIKPRVVGHWGTVPGLNLIYVHFNRIIKCRSFNAMFIAGSGHGSNAALANLYLEGTYTKLYPEITQRCRRDEEAICAVRNTGRRS